MKKLHMKKEVTRKEDGRYLVYYNFSEDGVESREDSASVSANEGREKDV